MSFNLDKTFEINEGLSITGGSSLVSCVGSPVGQAAPVGTYYFQTDGPAIWEKYGAGDNDWRSVVDYVLSNTSIPVTLLWNGAMSDGTWVTYSNLTPNSPIVVPKNSLLRIATWSNSDTNISFDLTFRKNSKTATIFHTEEIRNSVDNYGIITDSSLNETFNAGGVLWIQYIDQGTNAKDLAVVLGFEGIL